MAEYSNPQLYTYALYGSYWDYNRNTRKSRISVGILIDNSDANAVARAWKECHESHPESEGWTSWDMVIARVDDSRIQVIDPEVSGTLVALNDS